MKSNVQFKLQKHKLHKPKRDYTDLCICMATIAMIGLMFSSTQVSYHVLVIKVPDSSILI